MSMDSHVIKIKDLVGDSTEFSDSEIKFIEGAIAVISSQLPSNKLLIDDRSREVLYIQSRLEYIIYRLKDIYRVNYGVHDDEYNKKFVALTKLGRPSKASIESEIYSNSKDLYSKRMKLDRLQVAIEYIQYLSKSLTMLLGILSSRSYNL